MLTLVVARAGMIYLAMCSAQFQLRQMHLLQVVYTKKAARLAAYRGVR